MKKLFLAAVMSSMLLTSVFAVTVLERLTLPKYTDDLSKVSYKLIESSDDVWVIEVNGVTYLVDIKK